MPKILNLTDTQLAERLEDNAGMDRLLADVTDAGGYMLAELPAAFAAGHEEEEEPERWDFMG